MSQTHGPTRSLASFQHGYVGAMLRLHSNESDTLAHRIGQLVFSTAMMALLYVYSTMFLLVFLLDGEEDGRAPLHSCHMVHQSWPHA